MDSYGLLSKPLSLPKSQNHLISLRILGYLFLSAIMPISHHATQPPCPLHLSASQNQPLSPSESSHISQILSLSAIMPIRHHTLLKSFSLLFATLMPFGLLNKSLSFNMVGSLIRKDIFNDDLKLHF